MVTGMKLVFSKYCGGSDWKILQEPQGTLRKDFYSEKVFESQERVSGFPEKRADLRGSLGNFRGSPGTSGEPLDCCLVPHRENFRGSRRKTLGEVRGTSQKLVGA